MHFIHAGNNIQTKKVAKQKKKNRKTEGSGGAGRSTVVFPPREPSFTGLDFKFSVLPGGGRAPESGPWSRGPTLCGRRGRCSRGGRTRREVRSGLHSGKSRGSRLSGGFSERAPGLRELLSLPAAAAHAQAQTLQTEPQAAGVPPRDPPAPPAEPPGARAPATRPLRVTRALRGPGGPRRDLSASPAAPPPVPPGPTLSRRCWAERPAGPGPRAPHLGGHGGRILGPGRPAPLPRRVCRPESAGRGRRQRRLRLGPGAAAAAAPPRPRVSALGDSSRRPLLQFLKLPGCAAPAPAGRASHLPRRARRGRRKRARCPRPARPPLPLSAPARSLHPGPRLRAPFVPALRAASASGGRGRITAPGRSLPGRPWGR